MLLIGLLILAFLIYIAGKLITGQGCMNTILCIIFIALLLKLIL